MVSIGGAFAEGAAIAIVIKGIDEFSSTFKKATTGVDKLGSAFKLGGAAMAGVGIAVAALGAKTIKIAGDFEQTQVAFETMLGSAEEAKAFLTDLSDFAKKTPFTLQGVEGAARKLMAVGFASDDVLPVLKDVGDIASGLGLGQEGLDRLILNLGQVQAQGKLTGRELRDFAVAGIPLLDELSKQLGVSTEEVQKMVSAGEISTDIVLKSFRNMTSEGGRFANLMEKQSKTVQGRFSNLQDTLEIMGREIGSQLLPIVGELAELFLNDLLPAVQPLIPVLAEALVKGLTMLSEIIPKILPFAMQFIEFALQLFDALSPLIDPLLNIFLIMGDLMLKVLKPFLPLIRKNSEMLAGLAPILIALAPLFESVAKSITMAVEAIMPLVDLVARLIEMLSSGRVGKIISDIIGFAATGLDVVTSLVTGQGFQSVGDAIIRPDGSVIETDPNDTLIATQNPGGLGGGTTIIVQGSILTEQELISLINDQLSDQLGNQVTL